MNWLQRTVARLAGLQQRALTAEQFAALGIVGPSVAGVTVTPEAALGVSAVFCADRVIAEGVGTLPKLVYRGTPGSDAKEAAPDHPLSYLLRTKPNPEMTAPVFWGVLQHHANIWGYKLAEIVRDGSGRPRELWPIHPANVHIDRKGGQLTFTQYGPAGVVELVRDDVFFVPGPSPDGSIGFRLLLLARQTFGMAIATQRFGNAVFANGTRPSGALQTDSTLSEQARNNLEASWRVIYGGPDNAGKVPVLEQGLKFAPYSMATNEQLQFVEVAEYLIDEVARFFNITPVKLHKLARATWANLETLNTDFIQTTLHPWLKKDEAESDDKLFLDRERGQFFVEHLVDELLRADMATRFGGWSSALAAGWMTVNEVRARENLPPLPGGDDLRLPLNQGPATGSDPAADDDSEPTDPNPDTEPPADGNDGADPPQPAK